MGNIDNHVHIEKVNKFALFAIALISLFFIFYPKNGLSNLKTNNNSDIYRGAVLEILSEENVIEDYSLTPIHKQNLLVQLDIDGEKREVNILNDISPVQVGDKIYVQAIRYQDVENFNIATVDKSNGILWLMLAFVFLLLLVSGKKGIYALIGLLFSFTIIFDFIIPQILNGINPILGALTGAIIILLGTLYVSYGFSKKSVSAFLGIAITLVFVGIAANYAIYNMHFSGFGSEEALFLSSESGEEINLIGLVIAGIIIAAIGILDDIAITQASIVLSLSSANPVLRGFDLFKKAMDIGRDHISAVVNTLVLAYTGAALPTLLLFNLISLPGGYVLSADVIAEEVVRTLISTSGLIMAVPLTTIITIFLIKKI